LPSSSTVNRVQLIRKLRKFGRKNNREFIWRAVAERLA
jgi:ribosomal protein L18E